MVIFLSGIPFFDQVIGYFEQIWAIISNTVKSISLAVVFISDAVPTISALFAYLPTVISACCICTLALMVVKFIIAR